MRLYTIGFTKKPASEFFGLVGESGAKRLIDVRLNNVSQLAGFAKRDDLEYFLDRICGMEYVHLPELAPTKEMLDSYRKDHRSWETYESEFLALMEQRRIGAMDLRHLVAMPVFCAAKTSPIAVTAGSLRSIFSETGETSTSFTSDKRYCRELSPRRLRLQW